MEFDGLSFIFGAVTAIAVLANLAFIGAFVAAVKGKKGVQNVS